MAEIVIVGGGWCIDLFRFKPNVIVADEMLTSEQLKNMFSLECQLGSRFHPFLKKHTYPPPHALHMILGFMLHFNISKTIFV